MNQERKDNLRALENGLDAAASALDALREELQEEFEELSEKQQAGLKGTALQGEIDALEEASDAIGTALAAIQSATA